MFYSAIISLAQIPVGGKQNIKVIQDYYVALVVRVVLALAFQLLFTNLDIFAFAKSLSEAKLHSS